MPCAEGEPHRVAQAECEVRGDRELAHGAADAIGAEILSCHVGCFVVVVRIAQWESAVSGLSARPVAHHTLSASTVAATSCTRTTRAPRVTAANAAATLVTAQLPNGQLGVFIVPADAQGVSQRIYRTMDDQPAGDLMLDDVALPLEPKKPKVGDTTPIRPPSTELPAAPISADKVEAPKSINDLPALSDDAPVKTSPPVSWPSSGDCHYARPRPA